VASGAKVDSGATVVATVAPNPETRWTAPLLAAVARLKAVYSPRKSASWDTCHPLTSGPAGRENMYPKS